MNVPCILEHPQPTRCTMRTHIGVDYHRRHSCLAMMTEPGMILREGRIAKLEDGTSRVS